jgi:hypothetical protein
MNRSGSALKQKSSEQSVKLILTRRELRRVEELKFGRKVSNLTEGVLQTLGGFCQLALQSVNLFGNVVKLLLGQRSSPDNLMSFAVRFAECPADTRGDLIELAFLSHARPPRLHHWVHSHRIPLAKMYSTVKKIRGKKARVARLRAPHIV